jgi:hypothetical protein
VPSYVIPSDTHAVGDAGHTADHGTMCDMLGLLTVLSLQLNGQTALSVSNANNPTNVAAAVALISTIQPEILRATYMRQTSPVLYGETIPRWTMMSTSIAPATGVENFSAVVLPAGAVVGHLAFISSAAANTPVNYWFGLYDNNRNMLALTADQLTAPWAGSTYKSLPIATIAAGASATFTTTYTGLYYVASMQNATTPATLQGAGHATSALTSNTTPALAGTSGAGLTAPPGFPSQPTFTGGFGALAYAAVLA